MKRFVLVAALGAILLPAEAFAQTYEVRITNITRAQIMAPAALAAHSPTTRIFLPGQRASEGLAMLAEDGDPRPLLAELMANPEVSGTAAVESLLHPGQTATVMIDTGGAKRLSIVSMLVTTNDAFMGLESLELPDGGPRTVVWAPAYDAGSEANNEDCDFIPGPPCHSLGVRDTAERERFIHVHPGIVGAGDVPRTYDWRNPVARIVIIRQK